MAGPTGMYAAAGATGTFGAAGATGAYGRAGRVRRGRGGRGHWHVRCGRGHGDNVADEYGTKKGM